MNEKSDEKEQLHNEVDKSCAYSVAVFVVLKCTVRIKSERVQHALTPSQRSK
jgi:hypothetical protein